MVSNPAKVYIGTVIVSGTAILTSALLHLDSKNPINFIIFLALFTGAALFKGRIPGMTGTYTPVFFFVLVGSHVLSFSEVVLAAGLAGIVQNTLLVQRKPAPIQVDFNAANYMISSAAAFVFIHRELPGLAEQPLVLVLILGSSVYYMVNTALVSIVMTLIDGKRLSQVWRHWCLASLPYYMFGAVIASISVSVPTQSSIWFVGMGCPTIVLMTLYYRYWLRSLSLVKA